MNSWPDRLSISWIKKAYRDGTLTPEELIEAILERNEHYSDYHIWIVPPTQEFIEPYLKTLQTMDPSLPLWGIPFAIKDNMDLAGIPTTAACPDYAYVPTENATVVDKLLRAGAIPIGKTNMDQFATGLMGIRSPYGECWNALDHAMIAGGSSSGSAVSVALGLAAFALGTDTAGSIRVPAMLNNLVGYKPPIGSWSSRGIVPACASIDCAGVLAGNLHDARLVDSVARGYDARCPWSRKVPSRPCILPAKVYLPEEQTRFYGQWAAEYEQKWNAVVERIDALGIPVERIDGTWFDEVSGVLYDGAYVAERWEDLGGFVESHPGSTLPVTERILRSGSRADLTAARLFADLHKIQTRKHQVHRLLQNAVIVMPTAGGSYTREEAGRDPIQTNNRMGQYTNHCNLLDLSAVAIPADMQDHTRPLGITAYSRYDRESLVCGFVARYQAE